MAVSPDLMPDVKESSEGVGQVEAILQRRLSPASPRLVLNEALRLDQLLLQDHQARHQILPHPSAPLKITIKVQFNNKIIWDISPEDKHQALSADGTTPDDLKRDQLLKGDRGIKHKLLPFSPNQQIMITAGLRPILAT
jgi:hypothetical protein